MNKHALKSIFDSIIRPAVVIAYSIMVPFVLYYVKYRLLWEVNFSIIKYRLFSGENAPIKSWLFSEVNASMNLYAFNVISGIIFLIGWYGCMTFATRSINLTKTFTLKSQYLLSYLILGCFISFEMSAFAEWQVMPYVMDSMTMFVNMIGGYVIHAVIFVILGLLMIICDFPTAISLKPMKKKPVSICLHILLYAFCLCVLFVSCQEIYRGCFYDAAMCWFFLYTDLSVTSSIKQRRQKSR